MNAAVTFLNILTSFADHKMHKILSKYISSVVTDSEFASESANFSSVRPSPSPRIFGGRK